jgi:hypothetical protein
MLSVEVLLVQASKVEDASCLLATCFSCLSKVLVVQGIVEVAIIGGTLRSSRVGVGLNLITYETLIANFNRKDFWLFILVTAMVVGVPLALLPPLLILG